MSTVLDIDNRMDENVELVASRDEQRRDRRTVIQLTWSLVAGGSEMYAYTIASNLDPRKYRSLICALDKGGALEPEIAERGIPYLVMKRRHGIDLALFRRLYRLFRQHAADLVHTHHFNQLFYGAIGARMAGARIIHTEHSIELFDRRRYRLLLRALSVFCDWVVAVGPEVAEVLRDQVGIPDHKIKVIPAGVDTSRFQRSKLEARRELKLDPAEKVAAIVARLYPEKNHKLLLAAFADVTQRIDRARLLIVGDGTEEKVIKDEVARLGLCDRVTMMGVRRDIPRLVAASDVVVLSSDREGLPISLLEAMAAGRPVVATAVGDIPSVITNGESGMLVPPGDQAALADAITSLFADLEMAARLGDAARATCRERFDISVMIDTHNRLYTQVVPSNPSTRSAVQL